MPSQIFIRYLFRLVYLSLTERGGNYKNNHDSSLTIFTGLRTGKDYDVIVNEDDVESREEVIVVANEPKTGASKTKVKI